jgi:hypothetical protein
MSNAYQIRTEKSAPSWLGATISDPNLTGLSLFCAIGLLGSLYLIFQFPDVAAVIAQCNQ